ncbi:lysozyme inhibitor LprI family protein [Algibacter mikhailovii]|nr:lysozyme inhibitor LprI family protein [Algibacter mikhailovii]
MKLTFGLFFLLILNINSQNLSHELEIIEKENQECLDKGKFMFNCSVKYYQENDSLLNIVYNKIERNLNSEEKLKIRESQIEWLELRDKEFKKINSENTGFGNGLDDKMFKYQKKAEFVSERIKYLINEFLKALGE